MIPSQLFQVFHDYGVGVQQSGGRVHQGIVRHGGLAKDSPTNLIGPGAVKCDFAF